jgi:hypothetical protein
MMQLGVALFKGYTLLDDNNLRGLWRDPLLRHSNIFDGLFHERVIICESDADCMFYSAVISAIADPETQPNLMFTHTGGKHRLPVVVRALKASTCR